MILLVDPKDAGIAILMRTDHLWAVGHILSRIHAGPKCQCWLNAFYNQMCLKTGVQNKAFSSEVTISTQEGKRLAQGPNQCSLTQGQEPQPSSCQSGFSASTFCLPHTICPLLCEQMKPPAWETHCVATPTTYKVHRASH